MCSKINKSDHEYKLFQAPFSQKNIQKLVIFSKIINSLTQNKFCSFLYNTA